MADYQGKHKRREQNTMTRPRSKTTLQCSQARHASSRGYFSSAAPSGASGSGVDAPVCRKPRASTRRPTPDRRGRGHLLHPPSARAPPPRPRPLRWAPQGEVCPARTPRQVHDLTHYGGSAQDLAADTTRPVPLDIQPSPNQQTPPSAQTASRDACRLPPRAPPLLCQVAPSAGDDGRTCEPVETRNWRVERTDGF